MTLVANDVTIFKALFFYRQDVFAEQYKYKSGDRAGEIGYSPACTNRWKDGICNKGKCRQCRNFAGEPLSDAAIMAHFKGDRTLGSYLVNQQGFVNLMVLDIDINKGNTGHAETYMDRVKELTSQLYRIAKQKGLDPTIEFSGNKGFHLWFFFGSPLPAAKAQAIGNWLAAQGDFFEGLHVEVFPRQGTIDQFGNLVKVPMGVHLKTGRRCLFVDPETLEGTNENQVEILRSIKTVPLDTVDFLFSEYDIVKPVVVSKANGAVPKGARLPCVPKMWAGVTEGCRDEVAFRLAVHLYKQGMPQVFAENALTKWDNDYNDPPLGEATVCEKVGSAYGGKFSYGCDNALIAAFCDSACAIYKYRHEPEPIVEEQVRNSQDLCLLKIDPTDSAMVFCRKGLEYKCTGISVEKEGVKCTVELRQEGTAIHKDRLGLAIANRRKTFATEAETIGKKAGLSLDYQDIVNDLAKLDDLIKLKEAEVFQTALEEQNATYIMTAEEEAKAIDLLRSPKLLYQIKQMIDRSVVGEDTNKLVLYLAYASRMLTEPVQILMKGESSSGKSYTTRQVLRLFPKEAYTELTDITPQALIYMKSKDLRHHILLIFEKHGGEKADYTIRTTQSEGVLRIWVTTKDKETNEMNTKEVEVQGPVMFCLTTTEATIHNENETRNISLYTDDSRDQTKAIRSMAVKKYMMQLAPIDPLEVTAWQNIQRVLKSYEVQIPYAELIDAKFPLEPVRVRRDFPRFMALIETIAILHQYQRKLLEVNEKQVIQATIADYYIAKRLAERIFAQSIIELGPKSIEIWKYCYVNKYQADGTTVNIFTYAHVAEGMKWKTATVKKWTYPLADAGYIRWFHEGDGNDEKNKAGRGKQARWELTDKTHEDMNVLPDPSELVAKFPALSDGIYDPITGEVPDDVLPF